MPNPISSVVFCVRNTEQAEEGHVGKWAVVVGQTKRFYDYVIKLDNAIGKEVRDLNNILKTTAESNKVFHYAGETVKLAGKYVNPLIIASSAYDVVTADDKEAVLVKNSVALSTMFSVEGFMKKYMNEKSEEKFANWFTKLVGAHPIRGKAATIAKVAYGTAFCIGSVGAYMLGSKFGDILLGNRGDKK